MNRHGGFKGTVLQRLAAANVLQLYFQWKHDHTHTCTEMHLSGRTGTWQRETELVP